MGFGGVPSDWDEDPPQLSQPSAKALGKRPMPREGEDESDPIARKKKRILEEDDDNDNSPLEHDNALSEENEPIAESALHVTEENDSAAVAENDTSAQPPDVPHDEDEDEEPDISMHEFFFITAKGRVHPRVCDMLRYRKKEQVVEIIPKGNEKPIARGKLRPTAKQVHALAVSVPPDEDAVGEKEGETRIAWAYRDNGDPEGALHTFTDQMKGSVKKELSNPECTSTLKKAPELMVTLKGSIDLDFQVKARGWYLIPKEKVPKAKAPAKPRVKKEVEHPGPDADNDLKNQPSEPSAEPSAESTVLTAPTEPTAEDLPSMAATESAQRKVTNGSMDAWVQRAPASQASQASMAPPKKNADKARDDATDSTDTADAVETTGTHNTKAQLPSSVVTNCDMSLTYDLSASKGMSFVHLNFGFQLPMDAKVRVVVSGQTQAELETNSN